MFHRPVYKHEQLEVFLPVPLPVSVEIEEIQKRLVHVLDQTITLGAFITGEKYTYRYSRALALRSRAKSHTKKEKVRARQRGLTKNVGVIQDFSTPKATHR